VSLDLPLVVALSPDPPVIITVSPCPRASFSFTGNWPTPSPRLHARPHGGGTDPPPPLPCLRYLAIGVLLLPTVNQEEQKQRNKHVRAGQTPFEKKKTNRMKLSWAHIKQDGRTKKSMQELGTPPCHLAVARSMEMSPVLHPMQPRM
jgi:hypothetical protein